MVRRLHRDQFPGPDFLAIPEVAGSIPVEPEFRVGAEACHKGWVTCPSCTQRWDIKCEGGQLLQSNKMLKRGSG